MKTRPKTPLKGTRKGLWSYAPDVTYSRYVSKIKSKGISILQKLKSVFPLDPNLQSLEEILNGILGKLRESGMYPGGARVTQGTNSY